MLSSMAVGPVQDRRDACPALARRRFLAACSLGLFAPALLVRVAEEASGENPLASFDREVEAFMQARKIPGGALAVLRDQRLVYAKGYGWADREKKSPARPDTLFRIASLSKPVTAVAVLKLVEEKRLDLSARAFDLLKLKPLLPDGTKPDPRLAQITVRHLLQHTAGWDRDKSGDPMFRSRAIAQAAGTPPPALPDAIIRYMLGRPLDFDPGSRYAYSNFGYCVLGRVIEKVTGMAYEKFVRDHVLSRAGIERMCVGASLTTKPGEARYYKASDTQGRSVFGDGTGKVPEPYGMFCLEAMDAHGGWLASAVDLARFTSALTASPEKRLLQPETFRLLHAPPAPPAWRKRDGNLEDAYYVCGWLARPVGQAGRANYWHTGSLPGTFTLLVRRWDGLSWVALFNQRSEDRQRPDGALDGALHRAAGAVKEWPGDQFGRW